MAQGKLRTQSSSSKNQRSSKIKGGRTEKYRKPVAGANTHPVLQSGGTLPGGVRSEEAGLRGRDEKENASPATVDLSSPC